ncbi:hypothetical protein [Streptomyces sp. RKCA744]|uniref:hypothetical protein n=1 Tax=Streptomyces sp. RKCA744 TaxID=2959340 RepID=UPI0020A16ED7|nr:hypothetical protein [Streptomyces sp. RKCA744]MCO8307448.1 hypothetical protein [Streptomyces sp. RKCA744]
MCVLSGGQGVGDRVRGLDEHVDHAFAQAGPPPLDGGGEEQLCESATTRRSNSAIRSAGTDTNSFGSTASAANSSYQGGGGAQDTRSACPAGVSNPAGIDAVRRLP